MSVATNDDQPEAPATTEAVTANAFTGNTATTDSNITAAATVVAANSGTATPVVQSSNASDNNDALAAAKAQAQLAFSAYMKTAAILGTDITDRTNNSVLMNMVEQSSTENVQANNTAQAVMSQTTKAAMTDNIITAAPGNIALQSLQNAESVFKVENSISATAFNSYAQMQQAQTRIQIKSAPGSEGGRSAGSGFRSANQNSKKAAWPGFERVAY